MSQINVTTIRNRTGGPPELDKGVVVTGIVTATTGNITGNLTVGGTVTYEDVTNVDSVGVVTAGKGFRATTGGLIVTAGVSTFSANIDANAGLDVDGHTELDDVNIAGVSTFTPDVKIGAGATTAVFDVTGKVGLGTVSPTTNLHIYGDDISYAIIESGRGDYNPMIEYKNADQRWRAGLYGDDSDKFKIVNQTAGTTTVGINTNGGILLSNGILVERCKIVTTAWSTTNDISLDDGNVFLNTANLAGTTNTIDITSSNGIANDLAVGDMTSVTLITAVNADTAYINQITIGAAAVTESWVGGSAPTDGGSSGYDVYTFNIIKTAATPTYVVIANQVKGS